MTHIAALIGDPARSLMLSALMAGEALTATELAIEGGITNQTASGHLKKMLDGGLISVRSQGRHRYYGIATPDVAHMLETISTVAGDAGPKKVRPGPKDERMRNARVCYDHLAGEMGVKLYDGLMRHHLLELKTENTDESLLAPTAKGAEFFRTNLDIEIDILSKKKRPLCRTCLDWSVRKTHLSGGLGAALLNQFFERKWAVRSEVPRLITFTPKGNQEFNRLFS